MAGRDALLSATALLQRARRADSRAGVWEAADVQWWWREPRRSDLVQQLFWMDADGPVGGVLLTSWRDDRWQCDPILVPGVPRPEPEAVWDRALSDVVAQADGTIEVPVRDDDIAFTELVSGSGFAAGEGDATAWIDAEDRPGGRPLPEGYVLVDRMQRMGTPHPLRRRNGDAVQDRLGRCTLYDPELDLAVESADGLVAGYSLYWFDPVTQVGLVEPVRVEDEHQRRGLARAMLAEGIDRLARKGARRVKISYGTEAAGALYRSVGFEPTSTTTWWQGTP